MSNVVTISRDDERLEAANRWIVMVDEGLSDDDRQALEAWLAEDPKNLSELLEAARVWDGTENLSRLADLFPQAAARRGHRPRLIPAVVAAGLIVAIVSVLFLLTDIFPDGPEGLMPHIAQSARAYETEVGEQSTALLPDGTVMVLNTNTRVAVSYTANARVLRLERGEIHIEVAEDLARPLSVMAGDRIVQALGTAFSVEITRDHKVEVVVTEGKVVVGIREADQAQGVAPPVITQSSSNTVKAGEELLLGAPEEAVTPVSAEDIEVKLSWREGSLIFRGEPLEEALTEVERYTTVEFVFLDEELKHRSVSGRYRAGDVEALLTVLRINFNITYEYSDDGRVLLSSL